LGNNKITVRAGITKVLNGVDQPAIDIETGPSAGAAIDFEKRQDLPAGGTTGVLALPTAASSFFVFASGPVTVTLVDDAAGTISLDLNPDPETGEDNAYRVGFAFQNLATGHRLVSVNVTELTGTEAVSVLVGAQA